MLKVKLTFKTPVAEIKDGKPVIKYNEEITNHIVASTKSYNNLIEDLKSENKVAQKSEISDLFIDRGLTTLKLAEFIGTQIKDVDTAKYVTSHCIKALDGACVFKKAPIIRKK